MNLLARLLLETNTDFLLLLSGVIDSASVFLRQSGMEASTDGVAFGSLIIDLVSESLVKLNHRLALFQP